MVAMSRRDTGSNANSRIIGITKPVYSSGEISFHAVGAQSDVPGTCLVWGNGGRNTLCHIYGAYTAQ